MISFEMHIEDNSEEVKRAAEEQIKAALEAVGIQLEGHAQDIVEAGVPRHAGSWYVSQGAAGLRGSITHKVEPSENAVYIGTNNEHAIYNELGTGIYLEGGGGRQTPWRYQDDQGNWHTTQGITPLHFLRNALANNVDECKAIIEQVLKG